MIMDARAEHSSSLSDAEVVTRVRAGERPLFEILMRRYNQRLFRVARSILRDDAESEDVVQQTYVSAYLHLEQFAGTAQFSTWLTRIALNEAMGRARRRARWVEVPADGGGEPMNPRLVDTRSPEEQAAERELTHLLERAIDELPELYRVTIVMREVQQLSVAEIASCLELSEEAVKMRVHRGKAMLREALVARVDGAASDAFAFLGARCDRLVAAVFAELERVAGG